MVRQLMIMALIGSLQAADGIRALVDGAGCRTRQLTIKRLWEQMPDVEEVVVVPRRQAPAPNQRHFILRCRGQAPDLCALNDALGRRTRHYRAIQVEPLPEPVADD